MSLVSKIDQFLKDAKDRNSFGKNEVVDILLDLRREAQELTELFARAEAQQTATTLQNGEAA